MERYNMEIHELGSSDRGGGMTQCPFCRHDPYHYVDVGTGMAPAAVNCCEFGITLFSRRPNKKDLKVVLQILEFRRSPSPRKKARAKRLWDLHGGW